LPIALAATFVKQVKHSEKPAGDKYWRMDYTHAAKRKTLALGVYPAVSLAKARERRDAARELLADGVDPYAAKREKQQATAMAATNTFELTAREFHHIKAEVWSSGFSEKWLRGLKITSSRT
jgi:hypothetical protein